jgi:hypothetical protein
VGRPVDPGDRRGRRRPARPRGRRGDRVGEPGAPAGYYAAAEDDDVALRVVVAVPAAADRGRGRHLQARRLAVLGAGADETGTCSASTATTSTSPTAHRFITIDLATSTKTSPTTPSPPRGRSPSPATWCCSTGSGPGPGDRPRRVHRAAAATLARPYDVTHIESRMFGTTLVYALGRAGVPVAELEADVDKLTRALPPPGWSGSTGCGCPRDAPGSTSGSTSTPTSRTSPTTTRSTSAPTPPGSRSRTGCRRRPPSRERRRRRGTARPGLRRPDDRRVLSPEEAACPHRRTSRLHGRRAADPRRLRLARRLPPRAGPELRTRGRCGPTRGCGTSRSSPRSCGLPPRHHRGNWASTRPAAATRSCSTSPTTSACRSRASTPDPTGARRRGFTWAKHLPTAAAVDDVRARPVRAAVEREGDRWRLDMVQERMPQTIVELT